MTTIPEDITRTAWSISAKHLVAGQKDVTKMIADAIMQERQRCSELAKAALGSDDALAVFIQDPYYDW